MSIFNKRENYKPFEYAHITDPLINAMWAGHWTVNDFSFSADIQDYRTQLSVAEKEVFFNFFVPSQMKFIFIF